MADFVVSSLVAELGIDMSKFTVGLRKSVSQVKTASKQLADTWNKGVTPSISDSEKAMKDFHKTTRSAIKDISRVVTGILISQAFHALLRTIREGISAVIDFSMEMEKAAIAFTQLLGSEQRAKGFLSALEDLAAVTPIQIEPLKQGSQQLLAMGFNAKQTLGILETLTDTISATGGSNQQLIQATQVLGKIRAMGKLSAREIRSLATINIPIFDILREELDLTTEQVRNIGSLRIPAEKAVAAIVGGMEKRFDGLAEVMSRTMGGMISTIKDNLLFLGRDLLSGTFDNVKVKVSSLLDTVQGLRDATKAGGVKGFMQAAFSPVMAKTLELFGESIKFLAKAFGDLFAAMAPFIKTIGASLIAGLTGVITAFGLLVNVIAKLTEWATKSKIVVALLAAALVKLVISATVATAVSLLAKAIKALHIAQLAAVWIGTLTKAISTLLVAISAHPIIAIITAISIALLGLALSSKKVTQWFEKMRKKISDVLGLSSDLDDMSDVGDNMDDWADGMSDLGDSAGEAGEEIEKFLAPFDELNRIPNLDGLGEGLLDGGLVPPDLTIPDIDGDFEGGLGMFDKMLNALDGFLEDFKKKLMLVPVNPWPPWPPFPPLPIEDLAFSFSVIRQTFGLRMGEMVEDARATWEDLVSIFSLEGQKVSNSVSESFGNMQIAVAGSLGKIKTASEDLSIAWGVMKENASITFGEIGVAADNLGVTWGNMKDTAAFSFGEIITGAENLAEQLARSFTVENAVTNFEAALGSMGTAISVKVALWEGQFNMFIAELTRDFEMPNVKLALTQTLENMSIFWQEHFAGVSTMMADFALGMDTALNAVGSAFDTLAEKAANIINSIKGDLEDDAPISAEEYKKIMQDAIDARNELVPPFFSPGGGVIAPSPGGLPMPIPIPVGALDGLKGLRSGGIINKDSLFRGGEGGLSEGVIPLQDSAAMQPFAQAIAAEMGDSGDSRPIIVVGTLIADDAGLKKLNRKMKLIDTQENQRRGS